ncbi:D-glycero-alpha-D-manno-heptose-1,7-bisphosphate 7-phosphatase [Fimbriiglobus ruber]|uniref:D,D-heptose 1,7-bisphosphate phosphatase n=1 Tax=Fimbriiglobus ruber TaxID=1908690 RepID=A0A225DH54_9BACT|nr:HAD family hydrolase [Fimbriiglobus ruber]OWK40830.1 D-glycero-D-manno-heptose 1,7-bisphosphate phosphatase [Fimbriiglobus ruber]
MPPTAVFLDRDGTIIEDVNYLARPEQVRLIPGAADAVRRLNARGVPVVVVTNQAGVARGMFPEERVGEVHAHLSKLLAEHGAMINGYYYCPHHATEGVGAYRIECACRKPAPGMLLAAARDLNIDLTRAWMVGDKVDDARAGAAAGCRTILVRTGHGKNLPETLSAAEWRLAAVVPDLAAAVDLILAAGDSPSVTSVS